MRTPVIMALALTAVTAIARRTVWHVVVAGPSMLPTIAPGDRLVLIAIPGRPRVGDLVISPDPSAPQRVLLKRVHEIHADLIDVRGDNHAASTDSRVFGLLPIAAVRRCVAWRYAPAGRAAYVGRRTTSGRPQRVQDSGRGS